MVSRWISGRVSFRLHDPPAQPACWMIVNDYLADEESRQLDSVRGQFREL